ncbi:hypothetical protein IQ215_05375 [Cyanobacterium stanieri LEGE 03274]|uniref:Uncharacterized protein n=1 Tax=Cyanobacterium stanieri LEGE 03274 TaxID=1828756 RepID=A0ABR9V2L0_9CHRO|nr:hypothetical protein [Cyanobacterium stanieri]MBE9222122.1 hypothetical protein [Cyanobacterium stanieri LEGE 03274]
MNNNHRPFSILYFLLKLKAVKNSHDSGYVLVIAVGIIVALTGLLAVYGRSNRIQNVATDSTVDSSSGFFAAEAALNQRAQKLRTVFLEDGTIPQGTSPQDLDDCVGLDPSSEDEDDHFECKTRTFSASAINRQDYVGVTYVVEGARNILGVVPRGDRFQNLTMSESLYSLYALGLKEGADANQASAILQMDVRAREIPMFQFAAFYKDDLEILPGPTMNLNGPIHTDGSLYLGGDNSLNIKGQITVAGQLFSKRKDKNTNYANGKVKIRDGADKKWIDLVKAGTGSTSATPDPMDPVRIASAYGTQVQVGTDPISIPTPDILDNTGEYFEKADIRINYTPTASNVAKYEEDVPFSIQVINRTDSSGNLISSPTAISLTEAQRRSLRQPILVSPQLASIPSSGENFIAINDTNRGSDNFTVAQNPNYNICTAPHDYDIKSGKIEPNFGTPAFQNTWENLTWEQQKDIAEFAHDILVTRVQERKAPLLFSNLDKTGGIPGLTFTGLNIPNIPASAQVSMIAKLNSLTPNEIASLPYRESDGGDVVQRCFIPAPLIDIGRDSENHNTDFRFRNQREERDMRILQLNMKSMVVWNFEGQYLNGSNLTSTNQLLYQTAPEDSSAPNNSFQRLGMAARDISDGGLVFHATINNSPDDGVTYYPNAATNKSPYGFGIVEADQLPGLGFANSFNKNDPTGLTFASDQAVYLQGNYNTRNKQPASVLSDSLNVLSNTCLNDDMGINHRGDAQNCDKTSKSNSKKLGKAQETIINAAFLAGNDITNRPYYNGGLENYPRFLEDWNSVALRYRGSFVNISPPLRVSGKQAGSFYNPPQREWDYDQSFNDPRNLPPLTPNFVYLKQDSFFRSFDQ